MLNDLSECLEIVALALEVLLFSADQVLLEIFHDVLLGASGGLMMPLLRLLIQLFFLLDDSFQKFLGKLMWFSSWRLDTIFIKSSPGFNRLHIEAILLHLALDSIRIRMLFLRDDIARPKFLGRTTLERSLRFIIPTNRSRLRCQNHLHPLNGWQTYVGPRRIIMLHSRSICALRIRVHFSYLLSV